MVMGCIGSTTHGSTIVIPAPLFDPAATLAAIERERCTSLYGVPTMFMAEVGIAYGMTETSPVSTQTRADDDLDRRTATVGRVMPHVEIKVVDPNTGEVLPRGSAGEI